ncbi:vitamin B12 dependent-methionine synthase activation domain-containing protein [Prosthecobacter sp.]|uniref:vitamin B12 dependent-methionine synthase activation domain-containing protein n=1 Tax=Prosthecobacter sp. TaxID=1965333 RepID=UPI0031F2E037
MEAEKARKARERELLIEIAEKTVKALESDRDVTAVEGFTYTPYPGLSLEERRIEVKFAAELAADLESAATEYKRRFANVLDRNNVQELSPDYAATRESRQKWSVATLEPAGAFVDWMFEKIVSAAKLGDVIVFNAGGQGSGKTTATRSFSDDDAILVMDGTLQNLSRSRIHIQCALESGIHLQVRFVYCPWRQAVANMVRRSVEEGGRIVPLRRAAGGHFQAARTTLHLASENENNPLFELIIIDNSVFGSPTLRDQDWLLDHLHKSIENLLQTGESYLHEHFDASSRPDLYRREILEGFLQRRVEAGTTQPQRAGSDALTAQSLAEGAGGSRSRGGVQTASSDGATGAGASHDTGATGAGGHRLPDEVGGGYPGVRAHSGSVQGNAGGSGGLTAADLIPAEAAKQGGGKIVLATVKGDVHDIGKNIVGIVLACNGFEVTDMGVMVPCQKILDKAVEVGADVIGLSGLITPSLDEMVHVAAEMERLGFKQPLLIGGATTSPAHTAIKIAPKYSGPIVHVLDASRSVPVTTSLLSDDQREGFIKSNEERHARLREEYGKKKDRQLLSLDESREKGQKFDWSTQDIATPSFTGTKVYEGADLIATLREFIDWSPFFHSWELRGRWIANEGRFSSAHEDAEMKLKAEAEALKLYNDANTLLDRIIAEKRFTAKGVFGLFPANSVGDDIEVYEGGKLKTTFHTLRQQVIKKDKANFALSDYVAPKSSGRTDHIGGFCVGIHGADELAKEFDAAHDPYHGILTKAVADRLAEAFAEYLHQQARFAWGYEKPGDIANADLIKENYRGIRPAPGYPAQPDHTEKPILFALLDATAKTGVELTESMAMHPGSAVSGLYFAHPESHYFGISVLGKDQVEDYAKRKGMSVEEMERWLGPWLGY